MTARVRSSRLRRCLRFGLEHKQRPFVKQPRADVYPLQLGEGGANVAVGPLLGCHGFAPLLPYSASRAEVHFSSAVPGPIPSGR